MFDEAHRRHDGVVDRGAARRYERRERALHVRPRLRPSGLRPRLVVERDEEEFIRRIEQPEQELADRSARVLDALAVHAVADVEQHTQTDRDAIVRELRHLLLDAVLVDVERLARQVGDEVAFGVGDGRRDAGELDTRGERTLGAEGRRLRREACGRGGDENERRET